MIHSDILDVAIITMIGLALLLLAMTYMTARKIHRKVRSIQMDLQNSVVSSVLELGRQQEFLQQLYRQLDWPAGSLPPTRDWAASPDFLSELARTILEEKPETVVELGGGVSTLVVSRCLELNGKGKLYSFDHEASYLEETETRLQERGLSEYVECRHAPIGDIECSGDEYQWYSFTSNPEAIDVLIVDGPPEALGDLSRYPAGPVLFEGLREGGLVLLDDADRAMERNVVAKWTSEFPDFTFGTLRAEKGMVVGRKARFA